MLRGIIQVYDIYNVYLPSVILGINSKSRPDIGLKISRDSLGLVDTTLS